MSGAQEGQKRTSDLLRHAMRALGQEEQRGLVRKRLRYCAKAMAEREAAAKSGDLSLNSCLCAARCLTQCGVSARGWRFSFF